MRLRMLAVSLVSLLGLTACDGIVNVDPSNPNTPVSINNSEALKAALIAAGITKDVHVVETTDGSVAVWASVPGWENCPIRWTASQGKYRADKLQKTDGTQASLSELQEQPGALDIAAFALKHPDLFKGCKGSDNKPNPQPTN